MDQKLYILNKLLPKIVKTEIIELSALDIDGNNYTMTSRTKYLKRKGDKLNFLISALFRDYKYIKIGEYLFGIIDSNAHAINATYILRVKLVLFNDYKNTEDFNIKTVYKFTLCTNYKKGMPEISLTSHELIIGISPTMNTNVCIPSDLLKDIKSNGKYLDDLIENREDMERKLERKIRLMTTTYVLRDLYNCKLLLCARRRMDGSIKIFPKDVLVYILKIVVKDWIEI